MHRTVDCVSVHLQHVPSNIIPQTPAQCVQDVSDLMETNSKLLHITVLQYTNTAAPTNTQYLYLVWGEDAVETIQQDFESDRNGLSSVEDQGAQVEHQPRKGHLHWATGGRLLGLTMELLQGWRGRRGIILCLLFNLLFIVCPVVLYTAASFTHKIIVSFMFSLERHQNIKHV